MPLATQVTVSAGEDAYSHIELASTKTCYNTTAPGALTAISLTSHSHRISSCLWPEPWVICVTKSSYLAFRIMLVLIFRKWHTFVSQPILFQVNLPLFYRMRYLSFDHRCHILSLSSYVVPICLFFTFPALAISHIPPLFPYFSPTNSFIGRFPWRAFPAHFLICFLLLLYSFVYL